MSGLRAARRAPSAPSDSAGCERALHAAAGALFQANRLPSADSLARAATLDPSLQGTLHAARARALALLRDVAVRYGAPAAPFAAPDDGDDAAPEPPFHALVDAVEVALDAANAALDDAAGIRDAVVPTGLAALVARGAGRARAARQCVALDLPKPQLRFGDFPVDNSEALFVPPGGAGGAGLGDVDAHLRGLARNNVALGRKRDGAAPAGPHPLEREMDAALERVLGAVGEGFEPEGRCRLFGALEPAQLRVIDTEKELFEVALRLRGVKEVAVDLEHHSVRTFQGFICLMQISTRREDFVIDALALRGSIRRALVPLFHDPSVLKVMHGAAHDVQWLERDFGMYVVNLFDTGQAAKLLAYTSLSLSFLLKRFADVDVALKRKFQTADWRQRPLPDDMVDYARSDTHYLLYVYDRLVCELHCKRKLQDAWRGSCALAKRRYQKDRFDPEQAARLSAKYGLCFDLRQMRVLRELCKWRDTVARDEDESIPYVMPNRALFAIVRAAAKAKTAEGLLSQALKGCSVPPLVRERAEHLALLVSDALKAKVPVSSSVQGAAARKAGSAVPAVPAGTSAPGSSGLSSGGVRLIKKPRVSTAAVRQTSSSALFSDEDGDAESDSDVEQDARPADEPVENAKTAPSAPEPCPPEPSKIADEDKKPDESEILDENRTPDDGKVDCAELKPCVVSEKAHVRSAGVKRTGLGFDESSDSETEPAMSVSIRPSAHPNFLVVPVLPVHATELGMQEPNHAGTREGVASQPAPAVREAVVMSSLKDQYMSVTGAKRRRNDGNASQRMQRKSSQAAGSKSSEASKPFDYAEARAKKSREASKSGAEPYNPFASFLRHTSDKVPRVKRVRKNPKTGERSMSFRGK